MIMIKLYLISIVIWMIMIYGTAYIFEEKIKENGWLSVGKTNKNPYIIALLSASIPIIRVIYFAAVIIMVGMTKEQFDKYKKESDDESN